MTESGTPKPGWYPRTDMQDALGFWDGQKWTDQTQPAPVSQRTKNNRMNLIGALVVVVVLGYAGWLIVTSDDDLQCATDKANAALEGSPDPDCD